MKSKDFTEQMTLKEMLDYLDSQGCKGITRIQRGDTTDNLVIVEWE